MSKKSPLAAGDRAAQTIAYPSPTARSRKDGPEAGPHVVVLFGATGDLSRRKLLCGLGFLAVSGLVAGLRVVGTSLDDMSDDEFREFVRTSIEAVGARKLTDEQWAVFAPMLSYVPQTAGPKRWRTRSPPPRPTSAPVPGGCTI